MTQAKSGDIVKLQYTGRLDDNSVFETSVDRDPRTELLHYFLDNRRIYCYNLFVFCLGVFLASLEVYPSIRMMRESLFTGLLGLRRTL